MKKIYIAGPMTGLPDNNYPAFHAAAVQLRAQGHMVANPAENEAPSCGTWLGYMRLALAQLILCDAVHLLPGWSRSRGATVEFALAKGLGLQVQTAVGAEDEPQVELPKPDMWRDEKGLRGYTADPGHGPWYTAETVRALLAEAPAQHAAGHPDDKAVDAMAALMKAKLAKQRAKGYGGWETEECSQQRLSDMLRNHVTKGDPVDVANFCAFLAARGEGIAPAADALDAVRKAVRDYHHALDVRLHGGVAAAKALDAVQAALGMEWSQAVHAAAQGGA